MIELLLASFQDSGTWEVVVKVLTTTLLSAGIGLAGTLTGKVVAKNKSSKIYRYAAVVVRAAEQKYPNEGKKMGPEKMAYVMDQLAIKFPKIKGNTYLYNVAEAAVYELNKENEKEEAIKEFEKKYGEIPIAVLEENSTTNTNEEEISNEKLITKEKKLDSAKEKMLQKITDHVLEAASTASSEVTSSLKVAETKKTTTTTKKGKLQSF